MSCNVQERFGDSYKISFDPAAESWGGRKDPAMMQISCRRGTIYPHGGDMLAVEVDYRRRTAKAVAELPGVRLHQDGDQEKTFLFPVELFGQVAAIGKPRKRRQLTEEQRLALVKAGAQTRFLPEVAASKRAAAS